MNARHPAFGSSHARSIFERSTFATARRCALDAVDAPRGEALRVVLALGLDEAQLERCVPQATWTRLEAFELWPSERLRLLARWANEDLPLWHALASELEQSLEPRPEAFRDWCPADIVAEFQRLRRTCRPQELVTLVWCLLARRRPALEALAERLAWELEALALRRFRDG
ncbi:MAG: hypothetical protein KC766_39425 [Myxococcales bacterium]|nr:hypothetical protein [Myxococcales bacterium]